MEINLCPNCNAKMILSPGKRKWICEYCGTEILIEKKEEASDQLLDEDRFELLWDLSKIDAREHSKESLAHMQYCMNHMERAEEVEQHIRSSLLKDEDVAAMGINQRRIDDVMPRIAPVMEPGERVLVYGDNGIFARGKDCFLVTDKRSIFVQKKKIRTVRHDEIDSIRFNCDTSYPGWWLNNDMDTNITPVGNKFKLQGAIVAMICMLAKEGNPGYQRIRLM